VLIWIYTRWNNPGCGADELFLVFKLARFGGVGSYLLPGAAILERHFLFLRIVK